MEKRKYFGTDGIRGQANSSPMTAEIALKLGMAAGLHFQGGTHRHKVIIGKDTRLSGYMVEPALTSGFISMGMDVVLVGPMPTPAIAMLTRSMRADLGVMISASHNPYADNGIKLFDGEGLKLSDAIEHKIEALMDSDLNSQLSPPDKLGRAKRLENVHGRYIEYVKNSFPKDKTLEGLKLVIDCANGAAYNVATEVFYELGAEIVAIGTSPNGFNINDNCGSTHPEQMCYRVRDVGADLGIALDGDADRLVLANENGEIIDGDQLMAVIATYLHKNNALKGGAIAATVMSNMGLELYLKEQNIELHRTNVGDRYVAQAMREHGLNLGGEQSGHIILSDYSTTGDGILAALQFLAMMVQTGKKASELSHVFEPLPQILKNYRFDENKTGGQNADDLIAKIQSKIDAAEKTLAGRGRILIRKSGTEPLVRVMVEGNDEAEIEKIADELIAALEK
jgi:phosphoglucosamine mutase